MTALSDRAEALKKHVISLTNDAGDMTPAQSRDLAIAQLEIAMRALSDAAENLETM